MPRCSAKDALLLLSLAEGAITALGLTMGITSSLPSGSTEGFTPPTGLVEDLVPHTVSPLDITPPRSLCGGRHSTLMHRLGRHTTS